MKWILSLYPRRWQRRYRTEMEAALESEPTRIRTALDLLAGAIDAWWNPQWTPDAPEPEGDSRMLARARCRSAEISPEDARRSAAWMIGLSLALTILYVVLKKSFGETPMVEALLYATFSIAFSLSSGLTYLKPYSRVAQSAMMLGSVLGWYTFFLGVVTLGAAI